MSQEHPIFGEVIHCYTRAQATRDGVLIELPEKICREAGIKLPVAMTATSYARCVEWEKGYRPGTGQSTTGRLWDVLWMFGQAVRQGRIRGSEGRFSFYCLPRDPEQGRNPKLTTLKAVIGPRDDLKPVITLMLLGED